MARTNDEALGTLASLLGIERGKDGRCIVRLSDGARADEYVSSHIIVGGVPKAKDKGNDGDEAEKQDI